MSGLLDILKSIWDIICSVWEFLNFLTPLQSLFLFLGLAFLVVCFISLWREMSDDPKHHSDEYVKNHMHVFASWFDKHPEDKARYESEPRQFVFIIEDHSSKSDKTSKDSHSPEETPDHSSKKEEEKE